MVDVVDIDRAEVEDFFHASGSMSTEWPTLLPRSRKNPVAPTLKAESKASATGVLSTDSLMGFSLAENSKVQV